ncbi:MAG: hypothetical protein Q8T13_04875 [Acidobacteriota bacterium]|nr:hypothetical protein [Acidobacteriota bacterium]
MGVAFSMRLLTELSGVWTDFSDDLDAAGSALNLEYGIDGNGPEDLVAGSGVLAYLLKNHARNSLGLQGAYSPLHANKRAGWGFGDQVKAIFNYSAVDYTKFRGKVRVIDPESGRYRSQRVKVVAYDHQHDLIETDVREMAVQVNKTEAESIEAVLDAIPAEAQPPARDIDAGVDVYPYSADDIRGGVKAATLIKDYVVSAQGLQATRGDGTFIYRTRHARALAVSQGTFNETMVRLEVPSSLEGAFNLVRATIRPKTVDPSPTTVLWAQTGGAPEMAPGETVTIWGNYSDPADPQVRIGGVDPIEALVAGTDYSANSAANGSGADLTSSLSVVCEAFGTTAKFVVTNVGAAALFRTSLQVRGRGVYDLGAQTIQSYEAEDYGVRPYDIELRYQDDAVVAQGLADYVRTTRQTLAGQIRSMSFLANESDYLMLQALNREIGDRITVTETMTGLTLVDAFIQKVKFEVSTGPRLVCTWGLAPAAAGSLKILDNAVTGVLDAAACRLGYA